MIEVIHYQNESYEKPFEDSISKYYEQVCKLLPALPANIKIYFSDYGILPETGVGGYAYASDIITISLDPDCNDKNKQLMSIRPTVFHEAFHVFQTFSEESGPFSAIENSIYEGMATVFEREYADTFELYGDYSELSETQLKNWVKELKKLNAEILSSRTSRTLDFLPNRDVDS